MTKQHTICYPDFIYRTYSSFYHFSNDPAQVTPESFHVLVQEAVKEFNVCLDRFDMDSCIYTRMRNINQTKGVCTRIIWINTTSYTLSPETAVDCVGKPRIFIPCPCLIAPLRGSQY